MDRILESWLRRQEADLKAFETDLVTVTPCSPSPCQAFVAEFRCAGLVRQPDEPGGSVIEANRFIAGIRFGDDHLRHIEPLDLVWLLDPMNCFHPNINFPRLCPGNLRPGVGIIDILYQVHSILTWQNSRFDDFINPEAAEWGRRQEHSRFPVDRRPLKRRDFRIEAQEVTTS